MSRAQKPGLPVDSAPFPLQLRNLCATISARVHLPRLNPQTSRLKATTRSVGSQSGTPCADYWQGLTKQLHLRLCNQSGIALHNQADITFMAVMASVVGD